MRSIMSRGCDDKPGESASHYSNCGSLPEWVPDASEGDQFTSYAEVPWYRKNWFALVSLLSIVPAMLFVVTTGDVYYEKNGEVRRYAPIAKFIIFAWCAWWTIPTVSLGISFVLD